MSIKFASKATAAALLLGAFAITPALAADAAKEKCFGVAAAGENGCAAGDHSCAGKSTEAMSGKEWKLVATGTCASMGGKTAAFDGKGTGAVKKN